MKDIAIFGAGGHCYAVVELIKSIGQWLPSVVYDDKPKQSSILEIPVRTFDAEKDSPAALCITIGNNEIRELIASKFDVQYPVFIHKSAVVYPSSTVGKGTVILPNSVVDAAVSIGEFCIVNNNATVSHNVVMEDFCHVAINAAVAGGVILGKGTLVGAGSTVLPELKIGKNVTIGAGSVVTKDIPDNAVVYGNPGRIIKIKEL